MNEMNGTDRWYAANRWITAFVVCNLLLFIAVSVHLPLLFIPAAGHDDGLYMQHAVSIIRGHWLGLYSQFTLMKGPGYSIFLAIAHIFRISAPLAEAGLNCLAALYLSFAVWRLFRSRGLSLLVFVLTLWNFGPGTGRILRDNIAAPLYLIMLSGLILGLFVWQGKRSYRHLLWAGFAFGFSWITREDAVVLVVTASVLFFADWVRYYSRQGPCPQYIILVKKLAITVCAFYLAVGIPSLMNYVKYRYLGVVDFKGHFQSALESLQSIETTKFIPYAPVPREAREIAYQVSPTFRLLKDSFEDPSSPVAVTGWQNAGCPLYPQTCGDYAGGWFMWAFRDAAAHHGFYANASQASAFYRRVHDEVREACKAGRIACRTTIIPFMPHTSWSQVRQIPAAVLAGLARVSFYDPPGPRGNGFDGDVAQYWEYGPFLGISERRPAELQSPPIKKDGTEAAAVAVRSLMVKFYHRVLPVLIGAGFLAFLRLTGQLFHHPWSDTSYWIVLSLWLTLFAKLVLLALVDVSSFPAIGNGYLAYAFPVVVCASVLSLYLVIRRSVAERCIFAENGSQDEGAGLAHLASGGAGASSVSARPVAVSSADQDCLGDKAFRERTSLKDT